MSEPRQSGAAEPAEVPDSSEAPSFEAALGRLEALVDRLEQGELPLESALRAFEEGVSLARRCAGELDAAERRIEVLVRQGETWLTRPFEGPTEAESD